MAKKGGGGLSLSHPSIPPFITLSLPPILYRCLTHFFLPSLCLLSSISPPSFSIPLFILTSLPPCVVMCNVLKLARSTADCCRYRLISHKSGCSDQLPHRGPTDRKTDMGGRLSERVVFVIASSAVSTRCPTYPALLIER